MCIHTELSLSFEMVPPLRGNQDVYYKFWMKSHSSKKNPSKLPQPRKGYCALCMHLPIIFFLNLFVDFKSVAVDSFPNPSSDPTEEIFYPLLESGFLSIIS